MFQLCQQWQQEGKRSVDITLGSPSDSNEDKIWCFDYNVGDGFHVNSKEDFNINLIERKKARLIKQLEELNG
jgi:hypothetical protein